MIWLIIAAVLLLLLLFPLYLYCEYTDEFCFYLRVFGVKLRLKLPKKSKKKKHEKKKQPENKQPEKKKKKPLADELREILSLIKNAKRHILTAFTVTTLDCDITVATGDPCGTALTFGGINVTVSAIVSLLSSLMKVKRKNVTVKADYDKDMISCSALCVMRTSLLLLITHGTAFLLGITKDKEN